jgi:hypothetical protein
MPDARLREENRKQDNPRAVGSLILGGGALEALLPIPSDALDAVLQTLTAGRLRYVIINGSPLRYRQGLVQDFSLDSTYEPADLPPEEG